MLFKGERGPTSRAAPLSFESRKISSCHLRRNLRMLDTLEPQFDMSAMQRMPLAEQLVAAGMLSEVQLDLARREQQRSGGRIGQIVVQLGFVTPEVLAEFLGRQAGTRAINLNRVSVD